MKKSTLLLFTLSLLLAACQAPDGDIYILYDNDVHCAIEGYEQMAALRADYLEKSIYVNVVSCGDFAQGNKVGSISKGKYPIAVMNEVPYDYVTLGNHEFDYGLPQLKKLIRSLRAKCLCCNLTDLTTGHDLYPSYSLRSYGSKRVAFIGVTTPTTLTSSVPTNFMNDQGVVVYDFHQRDLIARVQQNVNAARKEGANLVILLSHLGDDTPGVNSLNLIAQTSGIDVVLDGHAHHVINTHLSNRQGEPVLLASTGYGFQYIGCLYIPQEGKPFNSLIDLSKYKGQNERVNKRIASVMERVMNKTSQYIGFCATTLFDCDSLGNRLVRRAETNLGDFTTDAMRILSNADIGICNGGGLRASLPAGPVTYGDLLQVFPFNNTLYKIEVTGQQLLDALAMGVRDMNPESGDFLHVSGLRYTVDMSSRSILSADVQRDTTWLPVHPDSLYTIGGQNYMLVCGGGSGMFTNVKSLPIDHLPDVEVLSRYIHLLNDTIRTNPYASTQQRITFVNQQ